MIPLNDLATQYGQIKDEIEGAVAPVLASGHYVLGPEVEAFKDEFARFCQTTHAVGVNSGTCLRGAQPQRDRLAETLNTSGFAALGSRSISCRSTPISDMKTVRFHMLRKPHESWILCRPTRNCQTATRRVADVICQAPPLRTRR